MVGARKPVRALVIGAGPAAVSMHLPVLARLRDRGEIVLALVCDIQRERAAQARGSFGFLEDCGEGMTALAREDIDAVYIFGSAQLHHQYGTAALRNGKHLFVEKPIAPSYTQACELAQLARAQGRVAVGGHNRRFYQSLDLLRARAGAAGWRFAEAVFHKSEFGKAPLFGARTWLGANGIHALDALLFMMGGLPEEVSALTGGAGVGEPAAFCAIMRWRDGAQAAFLCNNNAGARREEYVFHAAGETCAVTAAGVTITRGETVEEIPLRSLGDGIVAEHEAFLRAVRHGDPPAHAIEAIAPSLFLAELIESGFHGRVRLPVPVPETSRGPVLAAGSVPSTSPLSPVSLTGGPSVLVVASAGMQSALARWLPQCRLVSLEDVRGSAVSRPDIVAVILGRGSSALPADILDRLPGLMVVGVVGLSLAGHAPEELLRRGITLVNASAAYAESVAEFALGLAILGRRGAFRSHELMRGGEWQTPRPRGLTGMAERAAKHLRPLIRAAGLEKAVRDFWRAARPRGSAATAAPRELRGTTAGLIGWGANARAFAQRLVRARARVLVYSEHATAEEIQAAGAAPASLGDVLSADIVSLHRGLNRHTRHALGAPELARLQPGAVLINVARGALIEPRALLERLRQGDIFACLDTYEHEPLSASHPLRRLPNVFLTAHIAGGSADMHAAAAEEVVRKVAACLSGDTVEPITLERLGTMT
jgi:phosphoglycerate dehydrogenase-like enzyme/predicted dehydrogenase